ncbi:AAA family ATPase [Rhodococcus opacus]|uniref:AAA family ATPase n=1 Tax=Rhodococcus opacus TaxID=37919 RepID=A0AAX3YI19_RHOOP|nr:AAA family ATPase [Rhodococcus opacus]MCZ4585349.1 AAA family ATPase [Rhodococcus opacus]WLF49010.1 AAA family ATPase [Rhodococcus opacus]
MPDAVGAEAPYFSDEELERIREAKLAAEVATTLRRLEATQIARHRLAASNWTPPPRAKEILVELAEDTPPVQFAVEDLAPVGSNVLLVAEAKAGKTTLVMNLVVAMVKGDKFLDRYAIKLPEGSSITYSNFELEGNMAKNWLRDMRVADDASDHQHRLFVDSWKGYPLPLPAEHVEDEIVDLLVSRRSSVWVVDPYGAAISHDENSNDDTRAWTNAIDRIARRADLSLVVIAAHSGSSSSGAQDIRVRGAYRLEDWMSVKWSYTHGGDVNETPPDDLRYLSARGRDVAVPQFTLDYDPARRHLRQSSSVSNKAQNESERWALKVYDAVYNHEHEARAKGDEPAPFKAGDINDALGVAKTDSKPGGKGKAVAAGRQYAVSRGWLVETAGPRNSKLFTVGSVDPRDKVVLQFKFNTPATEDAEQDTKEAAAE